MEGFFPARLNICSDLFPQHCPAFQPEPRIRGSSHLLSIEWILVCGSSARKIHRRTFLSSSPPFQDFGFLLGFSDSIPSQDFWALCGKSWQGHLSWVCEHRGLNAKCHGWQTSLGISPISCRFVNTQKISAKIRDGWSEYRFDSFIQGWYHQYMFCNVIACIHMFFNNSPERGSMAKIMGIYLGGKWREDGGKKWCRLLAASANKSRVGTLSHYRHFIRYRLQAKIDLRHFISGEYAGLLYQHDQRSIFLVLVNEDKQVLWHRSGDTRD